MVYPLRVRRIFNEVRFLCFFTVVASVVVLGLGLCQLRDRNISNVGSTCGKGKSRCAVLKFSWLRGLE